MIISSTGQQELATAVFFITTFHLRYTIRFVLDEGVTYLKLVFLGFCHTFVLAHQPDRVAIGTVREDSLVTDNVFFCEGLKYLLEGRLRDVVLLNNMVSLLMLYLA